MPGIDRWRTTWKGLGIETVDDDLYGVLIARYSEPHRKYHTVRHLDECFAKLNEAHSFAARAHEIELALVSRRGLRRTAIETTRSRVRRGPNRPLERLGYRLPWANGCSS